MFLFNIISIELGKSRLEIGKNRPKLDSEWVPKLVSKRKHVTLLYGQHILSYNWGAAYKMAVKTLNLRPMCFIGKLAYF